MLKNVKKQWSGWRGGGERERERASSTSSTSSMTSSTTMVNGVSGGGGHGRRLEDGEGDASSSSSSTATTNGTSGGVLYRVADAAANAAGGGFRALSSFRADAEGSRSGGGMKSKNMPRMETLYDKKKPLFLFRDVSVKERQALFVKKLQLCSYCFDFTDASSFAREKEIKRQTLIELVDYVNQGAGRFNEQVVEHVNVMLAQNLFRTLPPSSSEQTGVSSAAVFDPEEEDTKLEPSWPHLQIVYEFLLRYVVSNDIDIKNSKAYPYIDQSFVLRLLELFDSEDPRERDYLKTILHRIYGKFMVHRPFIRQAINNTFFRFIYETEKHNGIAELLEILGSIINGFALPLKEEHKTFLKRALLPLHKPKCVGMYHSQLVYCVTQFVEKDPHMADVVIRGLLKYWPVTNSQKEVLILGELEEVLELTQSAQFANVMVPMFKQISQCINSTHFQVAERALFLWNNDYIVNLVAQHRQALLPVCLGALEKNTVGHWNAVVGGLTINVRKMLQEMDPELFEQCHKRWLEDQARLVDDDKARRELWSRVEKLAIMNSP